MSDVNVTLICNAADQATAEALVSQFPGGAGTFSIPLSTSPGVTDPAQATHFAGSGYCAQEMADAVNNNVDPMFKVFSNENTSFNSIISEQCTPPLYLIVVPL